MRLKHFLINLRFNTGWTKTRNKLRQLKISEKFILEISQFEKRFQSDKYHHQNNIFLLYFMNLIAFSNIDDVKDADRNKVVCIVFAMDRYIRNRWKDDIKQRILGNMIGFQDQFLGLLPKIKKEE